MGNLSINWMTDNFIDFEYKKYILLAYLNEVGMSFEKNKLYPYFSQVVEHYRNAKTFKENKQFLNDSFPAKLTKLDLEKLNLEYKKIIHDDNLMEELDHILTFSISKFEVYLTEGKKIYDFIENHLFLSPIGIVPLNCDFGYLFLQNGGENKTQVYEYQLSIFEGPEEKFRGIHTNLIETYIKQITTTYESMKAELIKKKKEMPNPATYIIETDLILPIDETLLPIAKRSLIKYLSTERHKA